MPEPSDNQTDPARQWGFGDSPVTASDFPNLVPEEPAWRTDAASWFTALESPPAEDAHPDVILPWLVNAFVLLDRKLDSLAAMLDTRKVPTYRPNVDDVAIEVLCQTLSHFERPAKIEDICAASVEPARIAGGEALSRKRVVRVARIAQALGRVVMFKKHTYGAGRPPTVIGLIRRPDSCLLYTMDDPSLEPLLEVALPAGIAVPTYRPTKRQPPPSHRQRTRKRRWLPNGEIDTRLFVHRLTDVTLRGWTPPSDTDVPTTDILYGLKSRGEPRFRPLKDANLRVIWTFPADPTWPKEGHGPLHLVVDDGPFPVEPGTPHQHRDRFLVLTLPPTATYPTGGNLFLPLEAVVTTFGFNRPLPSGVNPKKVIRPTPSSVFSGWEGKNAGMLILDMDPAPSTEVLQKSTRRVAFDTFVPKDLAPRPDIRIPFAAFDPARTLPGTMEPPTPPSYEQELADLDAYEYPDGLPKPPHLRADEPDEQPDPDDPTPDEDGRSPEDIYEDARAHGLSDAEARGTAWPEPHEEPTSGEEPQSNDPEPEPEPDEQSAWVTCDPDHAQPHSTGGYGDSNPCENPIPSDGPEPINAPHWSDGGIT